MKKQYKIVISGYYGYGSIGDDSVLFSILTGIAKALPDCRVTVLCRNRHTLPRIAGIETVFKSRTNPLSLISSLAKADLFISGGGSLLQDFTSKRSLSYYCALLHLAKLFGCKIFIYANGIGPVKNTKKCRRALFLADMISVRDPDSLSLCRQMLSDKSIPMLSADPVFAYPFSKRGFFPSYDKKLFFTPYFAVSLRSTSKNKEPDMKKLCTAFSRLKNQGLIPVYVSMQDSYDLEISERMAKMTGGTVVRPTDANELYFLLEKSSFAVGMRLHFLLIAAIAGTPSVALSYDPKVDGCMRSLGIDTVVPAFDFSESELESIIKKARENFPKSNVEAACRRLSSLAKNDLEALTALLSSNSCEKPKSEKFYADT